MNVVPCTEDGDEEIDEDNLTDEPSDLVNNSLDFKVKISNITNLPENFCTDIFCEYQFFYESEKSVSRVSAGKNTSHEMNWEK